MFLRVFVGEVWSARCGPGDSGSSAQDKPICSFNSARRCSYWTGSERAIDPVIAARVHKLRSNFAVPEGGVSFRRIEGSPGVFRSGRQNGTSLATQAADIRLYSFSKKGNV